MDKYPPILIIIPARSGSKRLIGKNKVLLKGLPLFMHSVNAVRKVKDRIRLIVSSDDQDILDYCCKNNIEAKKGFVTNGNGSEFLNSDDRLIYEFKKLSQF